MVRAGRRRRGATIKRGEGRFTKEEESLIEGGAYLFMEEKNCKRKTTGRVERKRGERGKEEGRVYILWRRRGAYVKKGEVSSSLRERKHGKASWAALIFLSAAEERRRFQGKSAEERRELGEGDLKAFLFRSSGGEASIFVEGVLLEFETTPPNS